jgi:hypothetical protein
VPSYFRRWCVATLVVVPVMLILVPAVQLSLFGLEGPHANDPFSSHLLGMLGFYGAYAIVAASFTSLIHTWLVRRNHAASEAAQALWAAGLGALSLVPQGLAFGRDYWLVNLLAGLAAGAIYGFLVTMVRPRGGALKQPPVRRTHTRR